jgi:N-acetylglucosaminyldiphosphoundecaprenol N-acetyl-beta-D-mannosaminyltransferase
LVKVHAKVEIGGVIIDNVSMQEAIERIDSSIDQVGSLLVVTPNIDHLYHFRQDSEFRQVYGAAGLVLADGSSLLWLSAAKGTPLKQRVSGVDVMVEFCRWGARRRRRVFLVGGLNGVAKRSAEILAKRFPGVEIAGAISPSLGFDRKTDETEEILEAIRESGAGIVFVGAGTPKQEKWLYRNIHVMGSVVAIGVGAAFDFVSGRKPRAPKWMQKVGVEWLWRLMHEPRRLFRRYLIEDLPLFVYLFVKCLTSRFRRNG